MMDPNDQPDNASRTKMNGRRNGDLPDERVRKLEGQIHDLEAKISEEGIAERVLAKLARTAGPLALPAAGATLVTETGTAPPQILALVASPSHSPMSTPVPPPSGAVLNPPTSVDQPHRGWFLMQLWSELRLSIRMYFDPRYRISRTAQFLLPLILGLFAANYVLFSVWLTIPVISPILERVVCVLLGIFFYKVMARELVRYREVLDYLAKYGPPMT